MAFQITQSTTPEQAIDMAYELATSLRATGWGTSREQYARELWVIDEFRDDPLRPFLVAGSPPAIPATESRRPRTYIRIARSRAAHRRARRETTKGRQMNLAALSTSGVCSYFAVAGSAPSMRLA